MSGVPVRVGLDGLNLAMTQGTGVATYAQVLGETLAAAGHPLDGLFGVDIPKDTPVSLREVLFFSGLDRATNPARKPTLRRALRRAFMTPRARRPLEASLGGRVVRDAFATRLPPFDRIFSLGGLFQVAHRYYERFGRFMPVALPDPPAIMHWTYPVPLRLKGARNVYTIHDLVPLRLPQTSTEDKRLHHKLLADCLAQAAHVCTVSETSRRDILDVFPNTDPERVTNAYQAIPASTPPHEDEAELAARLDGVFGLAVGGYFLFYGALEPKKNLGRVLEAYLSGGFDTPLVVVTSGGWRGEGEIALIEGPFQNLSGQRHVRRFDYLPRALLLSLVRGARAVVCPSLYEGFGLPLAEAMSLGVPVLTSTAGSLPEIAGGAALLVDPYDVGAILAGLRRLDRDEELRRRMAQDGRARVAAFSTPIYADRLQRLYSQALAEGGKRPVRVSRDRARVESSSIAINPAIEALGAP